MPRLAGPGAPADELIVRHAELVKRIAYHLAGRLPPKVEVDDLIQAGMLGLLEAATNYADEPRRELRDLCGHPHPRRDDRRAAQARLGAALGAPQGARGRSARARDREAQRGRDARDADIAAAHGLCRSRSTTARAGRGAAAALASLEDDDGCATDCRMMRDPFRETADEQFRAALRAGDQQRCRSANSLVMSLYYSDGLNLKEIGEVLKVTESRVCQLHGQALAAPAGAARQLADAAPEPQS